MTVEHLMCPPRKRLTFDMLNEVQQRLLELRHMAAFASQIGMDMDAGDEHGTEFKLPRDQGERLAFCVLNVETRIDDLLEFVGAAFNSPA